MQRGYVNIDRDDIAQLVKEPSAAQRSRIAEKICVGFNSGQFSEAEVKLATDIFRLLLKDTETRVRRVLSEQLKQSLQVPHDIIWTLANDKAEVAIPVLQYSFVLSEEDLEALVKATKEVAKLRAVAMRESISQPLSKALIGKGEREITQILVANKSASIDDDSLQQVLNSFYDEQRILEELVYRGGLPYTFAERLFYKVSGNLRKQLTKKYRINKAAAEDVTNTTRETLTLQFLAPWMSQQDITTLVSEMDHAGRLSDSVIIRSLCTGDIRFFETAIARRVGIAVSNARILIADPGPLGFKALYASAKLPESFFECVKVLLKLANEETQFGTYQNADYCNRMVARIYAAGYDQTIDNMDVLLAMIGRNMSVTAKVA